MKRAKQLPKENCALDQTQCESKSTPGLEGDGGGLVSPLVPKDLGFAQTVTDLLLPFMISPRSLKTQNTSRELTQGAETPWPLSA